MFFKSKKISFSVLFFLIFFGCVISYGQSKKNEKSKVSETKNKIISPQTPRVNNNEKKIFDSKAGQQIFKRQGSRRDEILEYKRKGYVGETASGLLSVRDLTSVNAKLKAKIIKKIEIENKDRTMIYKAMIKKNNYKPAEEKIFRNSMFKSHLERDPKGVFYREGKDWIKK